MAHFNNKTLNAELSILRNNIRNGYIHVRDGDLRSLVVKALELPSAGTLYSKEYFNPQTTKRFETLFDAPQKSRTGVTAGIAQGWPSQDNYAWALQNFINRRADPWAFKRAKPQAGNTIEGVEGEYGN